MRNLEEASKRQTLRCFRGLLTLGVGAGLSNARAQAASTLPLIAILEPFPAASASVVIGARGLGWVEGRTVRFEIRHALGLKLAPALLTRADRVIE